MAPNLHPYNRVSAKKGQYRIGIAGWNFPLWKKSFYLDGLAAAKELAYASAQLRMIEINGTFYSLQKPETFKRWYTETPKDFIFAVKAPRFITHIKKLHEVETPVANFFASGVLALKEKLGPILWQLPPNLSYDRKRIETFFKLLPKTRTQAATLAKKADSYLKQKPYALAGLSAPLRHALEVRNPSFAENSREFLALAKKYEIAIVCGDVLEDWPYFEERTAEFAYARLHGGSLKRSKHYTPKQLDHWAKIAKKWHGKNPGHDVFMIIDHDAKPNAPFDAMALQKKLGT